MKIWCIVRIIPLLAVLLCVNNNAQQFLNNSFEFWDTDGNPVDWYSNNAPGLVVSVTQTSDAYDGSFAARLEIGTFGGVKHYPVLQSLGEGLGHPVNEKYDNISGYYKFYPTADAQLLIVVSVYNDSFGLIGVGGISIFDAASDWTSFSSPIEYFSDSNPSTINVSISVSDTSDMTDLSSVGSYAVIDNVTFGGPSEVESSTMIPKVFNLTQNYPNPFNPETRIKYDIPKTAEVGTAPEVSLKVYDVLGNLVTTLVNESQKSGSYTVRFNGQNLPSGVYLYRLVCGDFVQTKRMTLIK